MEIHKLPVLDTPNQPLIRSRELGDYVYKSFKLFWKTNYYSYLVWLLLMSLDKVVPEKKEFIGSNSQLQALHK